MAYDPAVHRLIMFGGWNLDTAFNDTWAYDPAANTWTELKPSGTLPPARSGHDLVYDLLPRSADHVRRRGQLRMSSTTPGPTIPPPTPGRSSTSRAAAGARPPCGSVMVYDPSGDRLIMFGGSAYAWSVRLQRDLGLRFLGPMPAQTVFISHTKEDQEAASRVCAVLEADGIGCWLASRDAAGSEDKAAASIEAIRSSDLVLLIFSASANSSPYVLREIERAIAYERPVLSIHLDDAVPNPSLEYYLNLWQWLDASGGFEDRQAEIIAAVREQLTGASKLAKAPEQAAVSSLETVKEPEPSPPTKPVSPRRLRRRTWVIILAALLLIVAVGLGLGLGLPRHHATWTKLDPSGTLPVGRDRPGVAYDVSRGFVIMFGGVNSTGMLDDTWAYDPAGNRWTDLDPPGPAPPRRYAASMTYDTNTAQMVLFGGLESLTQEDALRNDTWTYDPAANRWTELDPGGSIPSPRAGHSMAYDPITRRTILFGGRNQQPGGSANLFLNDIWAYEPIANTWTELKPAGVLPPGRLGHAMAYDSSTRRVIVFGGIGKRDPGDVSDTDFNDTWAYDPATNNWTELKPPGSLPEARHGCSMAYDPSGRRMVMFGGTTANAFALGDTWEYDCVKNIWTEIESAGLSPSARLNTSLMYCDSVGQVAMFGGLSERAAMNDIWAYTR